MKVLGIIPARKGSKDVKNKNLKKLGGKPLIQHTIEEALKSKINKIVVSTNNTKIIKLAKKLGVEAPFKRPENISKSNSHAFEVYRYTLKWIIKNQNYIPDYLCILYCTTPFRNYSVINRCISEIKKKKLDWVFSVNEMEHHPYRGMVVKNKNKIVPLFDKKNTFLWGNRQELPKIYRFNGGVMIARTECILNNLEYNIDNLKFKKTKVGYVEMSKKDSIDIDEPIDFELANFLMKKNKSSVVKKKVGK